ncbi:MAG: cytochrome P450 [Porticoccaceae bacterium]
MNSQKTATPALAPVPAHVAAQRVYAYDYISDPGIIADPYRRMREIHQAAPPVFWSPLHGGHWVTTSKHMVQEVTLRPDLFSSGSNMIPPMKEKVRLIPLSLDPPEHTAYRMPLNRDFSPAGVLRFSEVFKAMANDLIDKVADGNGCDFLVDIAEPLPVILFMKIAGMPTDRLAEFRQLAEDATAAIDGQVRHQAFGRIVQILTETIVARQQAPADDLISKLLTIEVNGKKLAMPELQSYATLLFLGGLETVVNALSFSIRYLAIDRELQADLRAHPEKLSAAVEELLRLHGIASTIREVTQDTIFEGIEFKRGERILLHIPAANYDPAAFAEPGTFIAGRKEHHITFNSGPHRCLGANLARLELRTFLRLWLSRIPEYHLDPDQPPVFFGGLNLAVRHLPLVW